ncbi:MAG TPA: glutamate--tRNA ligase, partial [Pirellulaceae bacterium]|nr:glutamate--tRNA ligase [Pirellulaceae bacterium]
MESVSPHSAVRTRFAPSPTGYLHIGGVRTALFNWLLSKQTGGQFILRIDDTDAARNQQEALAPILEGFRWLGIQWDEGPEIGGPHAPYFQSQRLARYQQEVARLLANGSAYRDFARPEELAAERAVAEREKRDFVYSRRWMAETDAQARQFESEGRVSVVRLKIPRQGNCTFTDLVRGEVSVQWSREQDHVVQRADGTCLYHLASVVDDFDFQITHVVRAVEHLSNTPRQIFIAQSLGYPLPQYAHIPFVAEPGSKVKLSKRKIEQYLKNPDFKKMVEHGSRIAQQLGLRTSPETFNPVLIDFYKTVGYLPDAILNYLLLLGWSLDDKTEDFTREEMIRVFSLERVVKSEASFDPKKLMAFQQKHMARLSVEERTTRVMPFLLGAGLLREPLDSSQTALVSQLVAAAGDRIAVAGDVLQFDDFFAADEDVPYDQAAFNKRLVQPHEAGFLLNEYRKILTSIPEFDAASLEMAFTQFCQNMNIGAGELVHPLRVAVTGKSVG